MYMCMHVTKGCMWHQLLTFLIFFQVVVDATYIVHPFATCTCTSIGYIPLQGVYVHHIKKLWCKAETNRHCIYPFPYCTPSSGGSSGWTGTGDASARRPVLLMLSCPSPTFRLTYTISPDWLMCFIEGCMQLGCLPLLMLSLSVKKESKSIWLSSCMIIRLQTACTFWMSPNARNWCVGASAHTPLSGDCAGFHLLPG